jgi:hypothetical protein
MPPLEVNETPLNKAKFFKGWSKYTNGREFDPKMAVIPLPSQGQALQKQESR